MSVYLTQIELKIRQDQLDHQIEWLRRQSRDRGANLTPVQIEKLAAWNLSPTNFTSEKECWGFPTLLRDWLYLASEDNLPPKTVLAYKEWENKNKWWTEEFEPMPNGYAVRKAGTKMDLWQKNLKPAIDD